MGFLFRNEREPFKTYHWSLRQKCECGRYMEKGVEICGACGFTGPFDIYKFKYEETHYPGYGRVREAPDVAIVVEELVSKGVDQ